MRKFKNYKKQMGYALALISVFSIFQNGTCKNSAIQKPRNISENLSVGLGTVSLSPNNITVNTGSSIQFLASGGTPPYSYVVSTYGGGQISSTGRYTAPNVPQQVAVIVYDHGGATAFSNIIVINPASPPLSVTPTSVSVVKSGTYQFAVAGGTPPYQFMMSTSLGGSINLSTGAYSAAANSGHEAIKVTDSIGTSVTASITVTDTTPLLVTPSVANVVKGGSVTLVPTGGVAPYQFSIYSGIGSVAATGIYTAPQSTGSTVVKVADHANAAVYVAITVTAPAIPLAVTPLTKRVPVLSKTTLAVSGGTPPYRFAMTSGAGSVAVSPSNSSQGIYTALNSATAAVIEISDSATVPVRVSATINVISKSDTGTYYLVNLDSVIVSMSGSYDLDDRCSVAGMKFPMKMLSNTGVTVTNTALYSLQNISDNTTELALGPEVASSFLGFTNSSSGVDVKINSARKWTDNNTKSMDLKFAVVSADQKIQYQCLSIAPSTSKLSCKQTAKVWADSTHKNQWQITKLENYGDPCGLYPYAD